MGRLARAGPPARGRFTDKAVWRPNLSALSFRLLLRLELEGQLVDLAGELEWRIVPILDQRHPGARVLADIEAFILRERDRGAVLHGIPGYLLAVHGEHARTTLAQARTIRLEVEHDGVPAGCQLGPLPHRAFQVEQVVEEHHPAPPNA